MNKKIFAREFLFLLSTLIILSLIFIGLKIYNTLKETKTESLKTEQKLTEQKIKKFLSQPLIAKDSLINQNYLNRIIVFYNANNKIEGFNNIYKEFPELKGDSLLLKASLDYYATTNSGKYKSIKEVNLKFPEFFLINQPDIDTFNNYKIRVELLNKKIIENSKSIYPSWEISIILYQFFILLLILLFGFRYLIYTTIWAINTIKSKE